MRSNFPSFFNNLRELEGKERNPSSHKKGSLRLTRNKIGETQKEIKFEIERRKIGKKENLRNNKKN